MRADTPQAKGECLTATCGVKIARAQPPPEKCAAKARPHPPKPPRVASPEPDSAEVPDDDRFEEGSPPKKLLRDHNMPEPPWPPLPRGGHSTPVCGKDGPAVPPPFGSQF